MSIKNTIANNGILSATFNGKTFTRRESNGVVFYDISGGGASSSGGNTAGGASVSTGDVVPANPADGDLWFDESVSELYTYLESQTAWVQTNGGSSGGGTGPRAYVAFNGQGTDLTAGIVNSYNVDSINDDGVGIYTINLTNTLSDGVVLADGFTIWGGPGIAGIPVMDGTEVIGQGYFNGVKLQVYVFGGGVGYTDLTNLSVVVH
jgi:hypothetical protein